MKITLDGAGTGIPSGYDSLKSLCMYVFGGYGCIHL